MNVYFKQTDFGQFCLLENDLISNCINEYGFWESHLYYLYSNFIKPNYVILDGGANLGFRTVVFASLAYEGAVYSFEPQPLIFNILSTNVLLNGASNIVKQFRLGLSSSQGWLKMTPFSEQIFSQDCINYGGRGLTESEEGEESVKLTTIDSLEELHRLDLIKLDIQGSELEAVRGGERTIREYEPIILLENYVSRDNSYKDQLKINNLKDSFRRQAESQFQYQLNKIINNGHDSIQKSSS
jgi:FkbM family methyltransferase